ncbi:hypothetical protein Pmani_020625 [Petrolisthes manimaculis]|uniref:Uncharacterized protein n=1 Tax=Petrolisthes manimaculis TaxID=1843537 RepID=A0AAE1PHY7_9EUCA|nr:hypothetical protein Pmani_020625 [Petrolisthes manimaculis]
MKRREEKKKRKQLRGGERQPEARKRGMGKEIEGGGNGLQRWREGDKSESQSTQGLKCTNANAVTCTVQHLGRVESITYNYITCQEKSTCFKSLLYSTRSGISYSENLEIHNKLAGMNEQSPPN